MDKQIVEDLKQQRQDALGAVAKEMAWEEEKCRITLHKLESRSVNSLPHYVHNKSGGGGGGDGDGDGDGDDEDIHN